MNKFILLVLITILVSGCASFSYPPNNKEFKKINNFKEIEGTYLNKAEPHHRFSYLSHIIWRNKIIKFNGKNIQSKEIKYIKVSAKKKNLVVSAIKNDCIIYSKTYVYGKDIEITDGEIILNDIGFTSIVVGPGYEKRVIGLDTSGDGKYKSTSYVAGLAYFILPVAAVGIHEKRYKKLERNIEYLPCKKR